MSFMPDFAESQPFVKYALTGSADWHWLEQNESGLGEFPFRQGSQQGKLGKACMQGRRDRHSHETFGIQSAVSTDGPAQLS